MIPRLAERIWPEVRRTAGDRRRELYALARQNSPATTALFLLLIAVIELLFLALALFPPTPAIGGRALALVAPMTITLGVAVLFVLSLRPFSRRSVWRALNIMGIATCERCGHDCRGSRGLICPECAEGITNPDGDPERPES